MSTWVEVNGARVEKAFFDENVREAKSYNWTKMHPGDLTEHAHCIICAVAIGPRQPLSMRAYKSNGGHLCGYCYDHFLRSPLDPPPCPSCWHSSTCSPPHPPLSRTGSPPHFPDAPPATPPPPKPSAASPMSSQPHPPP